MTMTMREQIARAIASNWVGELVWDVQTDEQHAEAFRIADAVLAVMAKPTREMWRAAYITVEKINPGRDLDHIAVAAFGAQSIYRAMIAAAGRVG